MHPTKRFCWSVRDILALAVVALCALVILAALIRPGAGFEPLLPVIVGAVVVVVRYYFGRQS
jgi:hypothetical protein